MNAEYYRVNVHNHAGRKGQIEKERALMDIYKRYGFRAGKQSAFRARFAEYRMFSIVWAYSLALLFGNGLLVAWGLLFFMLGMLAQKYPRLALKSGLVLSGLVALSSFAVEDSDLWLSNAIFAGTTAYLAVDGLRTKKTK